MNPRDRLEELLADRATMGLSAVEQAELVGLLEQFPDVDPREWDEAAAMLDLALFTPDQPLPAELFIRLAEDAPRHLSVTQTPDLKAFNPRWIYASWGLVLALSIAVVWLVVDRSTIGRAKPSDSIVQKRTQLEAIPGTQKYTVAKADPGQSGEIVWHSGKQEGYLELKSFTPNDPQQARYQIWIVDGTRKDPKHAQPVDGGLFDVNPDGSALVPVRSALPVGEAVAFAITKEVPTGVVVSEGPHLMVLVAAR
jgi:hypothetical protein